MTTGVSIIMNQKRVITVKDYVCGLLDKWLIAIILIVSFALLSSLVAIIKGKGVGENAIITTNQSKTADEIYTTLSYEERTLANVAVNDFEDYYQSFELLNNSIIEKVDSYRARKLYLTYTVEYVGDSDIDGEVQVSTTDRYTRLIYYFVSGGELASELSELTDYDSQHIQDCISAETVTGTGSIGINIWGTDVDSRLEEYTISLLDSYIATITAGSNVEISLIGSTVSYARSTWMFDTQKAWEAEQTKIKTRLDTAVAGLSSNAYEYFKLVASEEYPEFFNSLYPQNNVVNNASSVSIKGLLKYAMVGAVVGLALYCAYIMLLLMYSKRVITITDYTDTMGVRILASLKDTNEGLSVVATKITATCTKKQITNVALITTNEANTKSVLDALSNMLSENGIIVNTITGYMSDYKELGKLLEIENCVIIEKIGSSLFSSVCDEVELCNDNAIQIIGLINIEK